MIEVYRYDKSGAGKSQKPSMISDVSISHIAVGYEVLINLKTRSFMISHHGGSSGGNQRPTEMIAFEDDDGNFHNVEWTIPEGYEKGMCRLVQVCKDQVIIYYIAYKYLGGEIFIEQYECPSDKLKETFDRLTT